jgi:hypothetical protein
MYSMGPDMGIRSPHLRVTPMADRSGTAVSHLLAVSNRAITRQPWEIPWGRVRYGANWVTI